MAYGYEKDIDYKKLMESAAKAGDLERAAIFEAQNNEKILLQSGKAVIIMYLVWLYAEKPLIITSGS